MVRTRQRKYLRVQNATCHIKRSSGQINVRRGVKNITVATWKLLNTQFNFLSLTTMENQQTKNSLSIPFAIVIAGVLIAGAVFYSGSKSSVGTTQGSNPTGQVAGGAPQAVATVAASVDDDAVLGDPNAPVTLIEFSDFQCPFCRKFYKETLPQIKKDYILTGKAKLVYRDFPLVQIHPGATPAAEGAECAQDQGKFWEMHDAIFDEHEKQGSGTVQFTVDDVKKWAANIGLDTSKFNQCLDSGKYKQEVEKDLADGSAAGVNGTPATFINGRLVSGAQPFSAFKVIIDEELKKLGK